MRRMLARRRRRRRRWSGRDPPADTQQQVNQQQLTKLTINFLAEEQQGRSEGLKTDSCDYQCTVSNIKTRSVTCIMCTVSNADHTTLCKCKVSPWSSSHHLTWSSRPISCEYNNIEAQCEVYGLDCSHHLPPLAPRQPHPERGLTRLSVSRN